jgi:hypothetical protein
MSAAVKNFVFADKTKFFELANGPNTDTGLPTVLLPVGAELYRADHAGAKEPGAEVPAFFTNRGSTGAYTRGKTGTLSSYVVKKEARLFDLNLNSILPLVPLLDDDEVEVIMHWFNHEDTYVNPSGFTPKNLADYRSGTSKYPNYLNRRMANIICKLGFDGWIVKPFDIKKRTGLEQLSYYVDGKSLKTRIVPYAPEIMLCKWKDTMDLKSLAVNGAAATGSAAGGRRRTRRRTHRK